MDFFSGGAESCELHPVSRPAVTAAAVTTLTVLPLHPDWNRDLNTELS
jgi:hypothetical protein